MGRGSIPWQLDQKATIFVDQEIGGFLGEFQWFMVDGWRGIRETSLWKGTVDALG